MKDPETGIPVPVKPNPNDPFNPWIPFVPGYVPPVWVVNPITGQPTPVKPDPNDPIKPFIDPVTGIPVPVKPNPIDPTKPFVPFTDPITPFVPGYTPPIFDRDVPVVPIPDPIDPSRPFVKPTGLPVQTDVPSPFAHTPLPTPGHPEIPHPRARLIDPIPRGLGTQPSGLPLRQPNPFSQRPEHEYVDPSQRRRSYEQGLGSEIEERLERERERVREDRERLQRGWEQLEREKADIHREGIRRKGAQQYEEDVGISYTKPTPDSPFAQLQKSEVKLRGLETIPEEEKIRVPVEAPPLFATRATYFEAHTDDHKDEMNRAADKFAQDLAQTQELAATEKVAAQQRAVKTMDEAVRRMEETYRAKMELQDVRHRAASQAGLSRSRGQLAELKAEHQQALNAQKGLSAARLSATELERLHATSIKMQKYQAEIERLIRDRLEGKYEAKAEVHKVEAKLSNVQQELQSQLANAAGKLDATRQQEAAKWKEKVAMLEERMEGIRRETEQRISTAEEQLQSAQRASKSATNPAERQKADKRARDAEQELAQVRIELAVAKRDVGASEEARQKLEQGIKLQQARYTEATGVEAEKTAGAMRLKEQELAERRGDISAGAQELGTERGRREQLALRLQDLQSRLNTSERELQTARAAEVAARITRAGGSSDASKRVQQLQKERDDLQRRFNDSEREKSKLQFAPAVESARLTAERDALAKQLADWQRLHATGDASKQQAIDQLRRDLQQKQMQVDQAMAAGRQTGVTEGRAAAQMEASQEAGRARKLAQSEMNDIRAELDRMRQKLSTGETVNDGKLKLIRTQHQQATAAATAQADQALRQARDTAATKLKGTEQRHATVLSQEQQRRQTAEATLSREQKGHLQAIAAAQAQGKQEVSRVQQQAASAAQAASSALSQEQLTFQQQLGAAVQREKRDADAVRQQLALESRQVAAVRAQLQSQAQQLATQTGAIGKATTLLTAEQQKMRNLSVAFGKREKSNLSQHKASMVTLRTQLGQREKQQVAHAISQKQAELSKIQTLHAQQMSDKEKQINSHLQQADAAQQALKQVDAAHQKQLSDLQTQLRQSAAAHSQAQAHIQDQKHKYELEAQRIQAQVDSQLVDQQQADHRIQQLESFGANLTAQNMMLEQQKQQIATSLQQEASQIASQAAQQHASGVAQIKAQSEAAQRAFNANRDDLLQQHAAEMGSMHDANEEALRWQHMLQDAQHSPEDPRTLQNIRQAASQNPSNQALQEVLSKAEGFRSQWEATRAPSIDQVIADASSPAEKRADPETVEQKEEPKAVEEVKTDVPHAYHRPTYEAPPRVGGRVRSLKEVIGEEAFVEYQERTLNAMAAASKNVFVDPASVAPRYQELYARFNENPQINLTEVTGLDTGTRRRMEAMQEGLRDARRTTKDNNSDLERLSPQQQYDSLVETRDEALQDLYFAKQRRKMMEDYEKQLQDPAQSEEAVSAEIAKDEARLQVILADSNKQIQENTAGGAPDPLWGDKQEQIESARSRNATYLAMEIKKIEQIVQAAPLPAPVKQQMVAERVAKIREAAKKDRRAAPEMPKDTIGPVTKQIIDEEPVFQQAVEYVSLPWWRVAKLNEFTTQKVAKIEKSIEQTSGPTIANKVAQQKKKISKNRKKWLEKRLQKYSLTDNPIEKVLDNVKNHPFKDVDPKDLAKMVASYKTITDGATTAEKQTPEYNTAQELLVQIEGTKTALKEGWRIAPTRVRIGQEPKTKKPKRKRMEDPVKLPDVITRDPASAKKAKAEHKPAGPPEVDTDPMETQSLVGISGYGLKKKPKRTPKRKKKKVKTPKKAAKPSPKGKEPLQTALQKWHKQKKTARKMKL